MKRMTLAAMILATLGTAHAADKPKMVLIAPQGNYQDGSIVPEGGVSFMMVNEGCRLPIEGASRMQRYLEVRNYGPQTPVRYKEGCWYPTIDGGYTTVMSDGDGEHSDGTIPPSFYVRGELQADKSIRIAEPGFHGLGAWWKAKMDARNLDSIKNDHKRDLAVQP